MHALVLAAALMAPRRPDLHAAESRAATALYAVLNKERRREGLPALALDPSLSGAAVDHVSDMAGKGYFEHVSPAGVTPWDRMRSHGCTFVFAGENLALATNAAQAARALFASPPHRANILNGNFTRVGIAVMHARDGRMLFVEDFAG